MKFKVLWLKVASSSVMFPAKNRRFQIASTKKECLRGSNCSTSFCSTVKNRIQPLEHKNALFFEAYRLTSTNSWQVGRASNHTDSSVLVLILEAKY